jgi:RNA polymerase sigma factor (sigma-70 family)
VRREPDHRPVPARNPGAEPGSAQDEAPEGGLDLLTLYEAHRERILRYCLALLRNPEDAEDAAQETFARAAQQVARLEGDAAAYLTTVARNVCYDVVRHRTRRGTRDLDSVVVVDDRVGPERRAVASELAKHLWGYLNSDERTFLAHSFAGFRYEEIAEMTGRSVPAVSVSICRARQRMRQLSGALGAAAALPLLAHRIVERLRRGVETLGSTTSAMASLDPAVLTAVILGTAGSLTSVVAGTTVAGPRLTAVAVAPVVGTSPNSPGRTAGVAAHTPPSASTEQTRPGGASPAGSSSLSAPITSAVPGSNASPRDVQFSSISTSPGYSSDHTAYAAGSDIRTCPSGQVCPVLFVTHDRGVTWTQRSAVGFSGGTVMIPAGYPSDATLFAAGPQGLLTSPDGGDHFSAVTQLTGPVALAPETAPGAARVAVVQGTVWVYQEATRQLTAGPAVPAGVVPESALYATPEVLLIVGQQYEVVPAPHRVPVIVRCDAGGCATTASFPQDADIHLATSGSALLAWSAARVYRSTDLGGSFDTVLDSGGAGITAVGVSSLSGGQLRAIVAEVTASGTPRLLAADAAMSSWTMLPTTLLSNSITAIAPFSDGRIASAVTLGPQGGFGLRCLVASTSSWQTHC